MLVDCDLLSLEERVRDHVGENSPDLWSKARAHRAINDENEKMIREVITNDQWYFDTTYTATLTSVTVTLPANCWKIRGVMVDRDGRWYPIAPVFPSNLYILQTTSNSTQYARGFRFEGRNIILEPGYANVTRIRIYYSRIPAPLIYGQATAGAATTMTLPSAASVRDDVYIGDEFELLAGTGVGQLAVCSDYVGSTKVATFPTWTTNPDNTTYFSSLLADPIRNYPAVVALGGAMRMMSRRRDSDLYGLLKDQYTDEYTVFKSSIAERQTDTARYGEFILREDDG
jgi:hypothetical protein